MYLFPRQICSPDHLEIIFWNFFISRSQDIDIKRSGYLFRETERFANPQNFPRSAPEHPIDNVIRPCPFNSNVHSHEKEFDYKLTIDKFVVMYRRSQLCKH